MATHGLSCVAILLFRPSAARHHRALLLIPRSMKRRRTFDLVSYLQRLHLLPERLTRKTEAEDLLKQLYDHEKSTGKAPDRLTSRDLRLSPEQLEALQRELEREGLTEPGALRLTEAGRQRALELTRAHRLYELYLAEHSGYAPEDWHRIAHAEEHKLTEREHERIARLLGNPLFDPHGDPIPTSQGTEPTIPHSLSIEELTEGQWYYVEHIEDDEPESFRLLIDAGLTRDSLFRLNRLESARSQIYYEGEALELPTFAFVALTLRPAKEEELKESHSEDTIRLTRLPEGVEATILGLSPSCRGAMRRRLMDLGFVRGSSIRIDMHSPLGNPTAYIVRGAAIALRHDQARYILIQRPHASATE